ncbi:MAG: hypothetical protein DRQ35_06585 [Gammaproteobacteria bacterium]|nr:MAG: hypothetical protein DRQ35_06585 [Gammaproteobacteria bacterium]
MSIRRKRRQRGKRKELRIEALKTWARLAQTDMPPRKYDPLANVSSIILPIVRRAMPSLIANELVGVQPMMGDYSAGIAPTFNYRYSYGNRTKKEISQQRKKERTIKKREKSNVGKALRAKAKQVRED